MLSDGQHSHSLSDYEDEGESFNMCNKIRRKTISWVRSLQLNSTSKVLQNGNLSYTIHLGRVCRQGDPRSPYLFVLAVELLAEAVRTIKNIEGLVMLKQEHKISLYADDTTLLLKPKESVLREGMAFVKKFQLISGLKVNTDKKQIH